MTERLAAILLAKIFSIYPHADQDAEKVFRRAWPRATEVAGDLSADVGRRHALPKER
jgi:hypothetical protein